MAVVLINLFHVPIYFSFILILACVVFAISFVKTDIALVILILSMLLSPTLKLGAIHGRSVVMRAEDVFLLVVFIGWLAKMAVNKEFGLLRESPINKPILFYMAVCLLATMVGLLNRNLNMKESIFYILKYFEYFFLFFMVINNLKTEKQIRVLVYSMILVTMVTSIYAWHMHSSGVERVATPFEGSMGESNTLGGYLVFMIMVITGLFFNTRSTKLKMMLGLVLFFAFPALLFTQSRGSWAGFVVALITLIILSPRGKSAMLVIFISGILSYSFIFPSYVQKRVNYTFAEGKEYRIFGKQVKLEESAAARIDNWRSGFAKWAKAPFLGYGIASQGPVLDQQYARILLETGMIGMLSFMWIILVLSRVSILTLEDFSGNDFVGGLVSGFISGLAGMLVHAFSAETFIIIKIMEPFWFLAAIVVMLHVVVPNPRSQPA